jgi:AraC-like DNA-binding protein
MLTHVHRPAPPLDRFVENIVYFSGYRPAHVREKLIPDGAIEIIVDLGERSKKLYADERTAKAVDFRRAWISGMRSRPIIIEAQQDASLLIIRFRPGGATPFLRFASEGIADLVASLDDVLGRVAELLRERVLEAPTPQTKMEAVEGWLLERAGGMPDPDPLISYLTGQFDTGAVTRVADLADEAGISQRHLLSLFRARVGLAPKRYARVRRFQRLLRELATESGAPENLALEGERLSEPDWAEIAARFGYADQSHLVRDFHEFAAATPSSYVAAWRGLDNYLPIYPA